MNARRLYNGEYAVTDVNGKTIIVSKSMWVVRTTDKIMSGWGRAEGKICKRLIICADKETAFRVCKNMQSTHEFIYIGCGNVGRCGIPYYMPSKYVVSFHRAEDCPLWNK